MPETVVRPLWRGRILAMLGILIVAFNLRSAVAALSPIFDEIRVDFPLSSVAVGVIAMLPPVSFAVFGIISPAFTRRISLELLIMISMGAIVIGDLLRAVSGSFGMLAASSILTFAGMGVGNVLLPPLVKRYFPDRIGVMTSLYATVLAISTLVPPLVAVPVADATNWRFSVGMWAALSMIAVLPWLGILLRRKPAVAAGDAMIEEPEPQLLGRIRHSPLAWSLGIVFSVSSLNAYVMFGWLPEILHDVAGTEPAAAGVLLSLYSGMGIPAGLLIPVLASRMKNVGVLIYLGVACFIIGDLGLIFAPATVTWLWVGFAGLGPLIFPLCLVLINLRTRTHQGAVALSGFTQGLGYSLAAVGPLGIGVLHQVTGGWSVPLTVLIASAVVAAGAGIIVARPHQLEDQLHLSAERRRGAANQAPR